MKTARDTLLLAKRTWIQTLRNPVWVVVGISSPVLYLVLFSPLLKKIAGGPLLPSSQVMNIFLPGIVALLVFSGGISQGFGTIFELQAGLIERLRVTPASRFALIMGQILAALSLSLIFSALAILLGTAYGFHIHIVGLLVYAVLLAFLFVTLAAFSISLALLTKEISGFAAVVNGLNLPLLLLSGVLLPLTLAPAWMRFIAHINPLYYVVEAGRVLGDGVINDGKVLQAFIVTTALMAVSTSWAVRVFREAVS